MSSMTTVSSRCLKSYYNSDILSQFHQLTRAGQRLLIIALSKLRVLGTSYAKRAVRLSFSEYCSLIQTSINEDLSHGKVRNAFYDLMKNCSFVSSDESVYSELAKEVIIVFDSSFVSGLTESDGLVLPIDLLNSCKRQRHISYPLALTILNKAEHNKGKKKIVMPIQEMIILCGGKYSDCFEDYPPNWRKCYVEKISNALLTVIEYGMITDIKYLLGSEEAMDPRHYDAIFKEVEKKNAKKNIEIKETDDAEAMYAESVLLPNYEKFTKHYRTYLDIEVLMKIAPSVRKDIRSNFNS